MGPSVGSESEEQKNPFSTASELFFFTLLFFAPTLNLFPFAWLSSLAATPVAYILAVKGIRPGWLLLRNSVLLAAALSLVAGRLGAFVVMLSLLPMGYAFWQGIIRQESVAKSGLRGLVALCLAGLFFSIGYAAVTDINPYRQLQEAVDLDIQRNMAMLSREMQTQHTSAAELTDFQQRVEEFQRQMPELLPAILGLIALGTIWINMVLINALLSRFGRSVYPWGRYDTWKLPEQFVWVPISATIIVLFFGTGLLWQLAFTAMMLSILLYFFQGMAVLLALLNRWQTPLPMRLLLYGAILLFPPGTFLLPILGLADVWLPLRQTMPRKHKP